MKFHVGDPVMHWTYGLGHVIGIEEREISEQKTLYYEISVRDLTVWVPVDDQLEFRLRPPTTREGFDELFTILTGAGESLPEDRQERKTFLLDLFKESHARSLCRVIRDLSTFHQRHSLNEYDQSLMKRAHDALLSEWVHAFAIPLTTAETELRRMLAVNAVGGVKS